MSKRGHVLICILIAGALLVSSAVAEVPQVLSFQGNLQDSEGNPVDGTVSTTFHIYDVEESGTPLWSETQDVEYAAGFFSVELGNQTPLPDETFYAERYLTMEISGDEEEFLPRRRITSGAFAIRSKFVDNISIENIQQFWQLAQSTPDFDGDGHDKISMDGDDCDDLNPFVYPGADEYCDGLDNDCDGTVDENTVDCPDGYVCFNLQCVIADNDGDGWPYDQDCDDNDPNVYPGAPELCNGIDDDCNGTVDDNVTDCPTGTECVNGTCTFIDNDGDGWPYDQDCDDNDPNVYPGAPELCNGIDDDCNGTIDDVDNDGDGFYACLDDCDDDDPNVYPGAPELCNGIDDDCNGTVDDNVTDCPTGTECVNGTCTFIDNDGDGWPYDQDCDDNDPNVYPGAPELCNGIDDDCDGTIDDNVTDCPSGTECINGTCTFIDNDGDGWPYDQDCDDNDPNVYPGAPEICDGIDNDCNGMVDDRDEDGDGYYACFDDCDDTDPNVNPGMQEICGDQIDNNCDGQVDEGCP